MPEIAPISKQNRPHWAEMDIRNPRSTSKIFESGKVICIGTKSFDDAKLACKKIAKSIKNLGFPVRFTKFRISNIWTSLKFPKSL